MAAFSTMAAIAGAALGAGASIYGANKQKEAADKAARASKRATDQSLEFQRETRDLIRADQEPWRQAGIGALGRLENPLASFEASPDYNFRVSEGMKAVNTNRAVNGLLKSGSALRGTVELGQNLGGAEFGNWWGRQANLAGLGSNANSVNANAGQFAAGQMQNALFQNAGNLASSYQTGANATAQGVGGLAGALGWGLMNFPWGGSQSVPAGVHGGVISPMQTGTPWSLWRN